MSETVLCTACGAGVAPEELNVGRWLEPRAVERMQQHHPEWKRSDGACPACVQQLLLELLEERGEAALHQGIQAWWPIDPESAFGAIPTPLRLHAHPSYTGRGVTIAFVDSGFHPHPDLTMPDNRIRAWVDATSTPVASLEFGRDERPRWPGWDDDAGSRWHGLMTSTSAAGNGWLSDGFYRGLGSGADVVLVRAWKEGEGISDASILRALGWIRENASRYGIRVVSLSVAGDVVRPGEHDAIATAIRILTDAGITVVAAAGNDGVRHLVPPASSPDALTIGGIDDRSSFDHDAVVLWHSNFGESGTKPEVVAPSIWVVAPVLPGSEVARDAEALFAARAAGDPAVEGEIEKLRLVTPHYQHVEGTSFAAPVAASLVSCLLEANPLLQPNEIRNVLLATARSVKGASVERQGGGVIDAGRAVSLALAMVSTPSIVLSSPDGSGAAITLRRVDAEAREVHVRGSWDGWFRALPATRIPGSDVWEIHLDGIGEGLHRYKFVVDGEDWVPDALNARREEDGFGGWNSVVEVHQET